MLQIPSQWSRSGREALPKVRKGLGGPPGGPGVVRRHFRRFGLGREALSVDRDGWKALPKVWEGSGGPPGVPGRVGRPTRTSGTSLEAFRRSVTSGRPSWRSGTGLKVL